MDDNRQRSILIYKNVIASVVIKGMAALISLLLVPLTIDCLGTFKNGVWLTISSVLLWIDQMDIGLGNGMRNKLAIYSARDDAQEGRKIVSSTIAMLSFIMLIAMLVLLFLVWNTNVFSFFNVSAAEIPELRIALTCAVILVCMTFVLKSVGNVYMGMQMPAVNNLLVVLGQLLVLSITWWLYVEGYASFLAIVITNLASPLVVYALAFPYTFYVQFPQLRPSFHLINLRSALELGNLGVKFFWIQIASVIQFMTANLLISNFFSPAMVTPYQIAFRYLSLPTVLFSIICMPFWNATTDAYEKNDMDWINKANRKMNFTIAGMALLIVVMVVASEWVYSIWIGDSCSVPFGMTCLVALYVFLLILSMRYSIFLNGIGALRLQMYMTLMTVVFIPLSYFVSKYTHDIQWFLAVMSFCVAPSIVVNMIQFRKIRNGTAKGIWRK